MTTGREVVSGGALWFCANSDVEISALSGIPINGVAFENDDAGSKTSPISPIVATTVIRDERRCEVFLFVFVVFIVTGAVVILSYQVFILRRFSRRFP